MALVILCATIVGALVARLVYPELLPVLDALTIIFYLIIAVTVIAVLRNFVGLITYGVFGPSIISIGLNRIGSLVWGLIAVFAVLAVGILMRLALEPLKLQMTHRLALVVIAIAFTMGAITLVGAGIGNAAFSYVDFLPILITSWIAERFIKDRLESGSTMCYKRLTYTMIAVLASYLLISERAIVDAFIYAPEMWILPVAINMLVGSSVHLRLTERFRFKRLKEGGNPGGGGFSRILTINVRNRDFVEKYNPRETHPNITKLSVKAALKEANVPVPETIATLESFRDLERLEEILSKTPKNKGFVVKPNSGFGGRGILVIKGRDNGFVRRSDGRSMDLDGLRRHIEATIDGEFSGRWLPDKAFLEEMVEPSHEMAMLCHSGLPDIRVIVFRGVPVMAMARLPTKRSGGKANLAQGALGAGVDIASGEIRTAVVAHDRKPITNHPDTGLNLIGRRIPFWNDILEMSVKAQKAIGIGYAGIDIVIDENRGPMVMEGNKRPGLEIQNANHEPLLKRLRAVERLLGGRKEITVREGLQIMKSLNEADWKLPRMKEKHKGGIAT